MTRAQAIEYALKKIPEILPLEESDIRTLCDQILTDSNLNPDLIAQGFLDILGHEDAPFEFVIDFNRILLEKDVQKVAKANTSSSSNASVVANANNTIKEKQQMSIATHTPKLSTTIDKSRHSNKVKNLKVENVSTTKTTKITKEENISKAQKQKLIEEIDDVWKFLELEHNEKNAKQYSCSCQGKRHPLFEATPNCLSCGKIICVQEGLHLNNCSYCGEELIPLEEKLKIIQLLKKEKEYLSSESKKVTMPTHPQRGNTKNKYAKSYKISSGMGTNLFTEQDKLFNLIERQQERERKRNQVLKLQEENKREELKVNKQEEEKQSMDPELWEAQQRLEKLLHFQDTSAERTKIIDNASDFSISDESSIWGSAEQRALIIKKQQRNLRNFEKMEQERNGKREKYVVSMNIGADGKVVMNEVIKDNPRVLVDSDDEFEDISDDEERRDLGDIRTIKNEIEKGNDMENNYLQSKVWDYEKYGKKFARPKYVGGSLDSTKKKDITTEKDKSPSRIQIENSDETFWDKIV